MRLTKRIEKLEKTQNEMLKCFRTDYSMSSFFNGYPYGIEIKPEKVQTQKALNVTLKELAAYVLDGTPIRRTDSTPQIVYGVKEKKQATDSDGCDQSKQKA